MGLNWGELWEQGKDQLQNAFDDVIEQGVPAIQAGLEQQAIDWLEEQHKVTTKKVEDNVQAILSDPNQSSSFVQGIKQGAIGGALKEYGPLIIGGVVALIVVGFMIRGKK